MLVNQKIVLYLFINDSLRSCLCVLSSEREIEILEELGLKKTIPATANTSTQGPIPVTKKDDPYCDRTTFGLTFSGKYF